MKNTIVKVLTAEYHSIANHKYSNKEYVKKKIIILKIIKLYNYLKFFKGMDEKF